MLFTLSNACLDSATAVLTQATKETELQRIKSEREQRMKRRMEEREARTRSTMDGGSKKDERDSEKAKGEERTPSEESPSVSAKSTETELSESDPVSVQTSIDSCSSGVADAFDTSNGINEADPAVTFVDDEPRDDDERHTSISNRQTHSSSCIEMTEDPANTTTIIISQSTGGLSPEVQRRRNVKKRRSRGFLAASQVQKLFI